MGRVDGKVVLISGGARGMGAEAVGLLARAGARVVSGDILDDLGQQVEADQGPAARMSPTSTGTLPAKPTGRPSL